MVGGPAGQKVGLVGAANGVCGTEKSSACCMIHGYLLGAKTKISRPRGERGLKVGDMGS